MIQQQQSQPPREPMPGREAVRNILYVSWLAWTFPARLAYTWWTGSPP